METKPHVCPVWVGYIMSSPLRKLQQDPDKILKPYIKPGMKILEVGPAMGFFSIPMAKMTGPEGRLYCVDIQQNMLQKLAERAFKKGVAERLETILASGTSQNIESLKDKIDFCLLAYVVHEVPDPKSFFIEIAKSMKKGARVLFIEPKGHVKEAQWQESLRLARAAGLHPAREVSISGSRAFELIKS